MNTVMSVNTPPCVYLQKSLNQENWDELVLSAVQDDRELQLQLVDHLVDYLEMNEGARWARHFQLPLEEIPSQVAELLTSGEQ